MQKTIVDGVRATTTALHFYSLKVTDIKNPTGKYLA
jgi:hypothetical protein